MWKRLASVVVSLAVLAIAPRGRAAEGPAPRDVIDAIDKGVDFLKGQQEQDGGWSAESRHPLGMTALAALALLENGVDRDDPAIKRADKFIKALVPHETQTYDLSLAILFLSRVQPENPGPNDDLIRRLARRLAGGNMRGMWTYHVPMEANFYEPIEPKPYGPVVADPEDQPSGSRRKAETGSAKKAKAKPARKRGGGRGNPRPNGFGPQFPQDMMTPWRGDNSNTQFALLGMWVASRHGFDSDLALAAIDGHFRESPLRDGSWGYTLNAPGSYGTQAMSCAGLMGLAIWAARPKQADIESPQERGNQLDKDPVFARGLEVVAADAKRISPKSAVYYLWSLERVCVALGLKKLDGFDWYAAGARELLNRQRADGSWPTGDHGAMPETCLALLFLRKANLAFELEKEIKLPKSEPIEPPKRAPEVAKAPEPEPEPEPAQVAMVGPIVPHDLPEVLPTPSAEAPAPRTNEVSVIVRQVEEDGFPVIGVDYEVRNPDGSPLTTAKKEDFHVKEYDQDVPILDFQGPARTTRPTTVVLVVDRSQSMVNEDRIGGLKRAVATFLSKMPAGSRVAVIAFGSDVKLICPFTSNPRQVETAVNALTPEGNTRYYDAVTEAIQLLDKEPGRRAVLALTDGKNNLGQATLNSVIIDARRAGLPVHTLSLGTEAEIPSDALRQLAMETRGQYFPARQADQLHGIFEELAKGLGSSYHLTYRTARPLPDGTLRPVKVSYRASRIAGRATVFIRGMVVPATGWSWLFLALVATLGGLALLPVRWRRRDVGVVGNGQWPMANDQ